MEHAKFMLQQITEITKRKSKISNQSSKKKYPKLPDKKE